MQMWMYKGASRYTKTSDSIISGTRRRTWKNGTNVIVELDDGFKWSDKYGNWRLYNLSGTLLSYGTINGTVAKLLYDAQGVLVGLTDRNDRQVVWYEYAEDGTPSAVYDYSGRRVEYSCSMAGTSLLIHDVSTLLADGRKVTTSYEYDANTGDQSVSQGTRIAKLIDAGGRTTTVEYQGSAPSAVSDSNGNIKRFQYYYDSSKKLFRSLVTSPSGQTKETWYTPGGEMRRGMQNSAQLLATVKRDRDYTFIDEKGNRTTMYFDEVDNLKKVVYPDGTSISSTYDPVLNLPLTATDQAGIVTEMKYDERGNTRETILAKGTPAEQVRRFTYDDYGQLVTSTLVGDERTAEATTTYTYDDHGNTATVTDAEGNVTSFPEHDAMGNVLRIHNARGYDWTFDYDTLGRLRSTSDPRGNVTSYTYDDANNLTAVTDALGHRTSFTYNDQNQVTSKRDALGNVTTMSFDGDHRPTVTHDAESRQISVDYDDRGRLVQSKDYAGNVTHTGYSDDPALPQSSLLTEYIAYPTFTRNYLYDVMQRIIHVEDAGPENFSLSTSTTYDVRGLTSTVTDEEGNVTRFDYDELGRVSVTHAIDGGTNGVIYDDANRVVSVTNANGGISAAEYDRLGRVVKTRRPMGQETTFRYDPIGNLLEKKDARGQRVVHHYDELNRRVRTEYFAQGASAAERTVEYGYDAVGRMVSWQDGPTSGTYVYL